MAGKMTREQYLERAARELGPLFKRAGHTVPKLRISVGWPLGRRTSGGQQTIGQHFHPTSSADGISQIFISPVLAGGLSALAVLAHEMVHAVVPDAGHKAPFRKIALAIGLAGKMTATHAGPELTKKLEAITAKLGPYPHSRLSGAYAKQDTRMIKIECSECGCILRGSRKALSIGTPECACGAGPMLAHDW